MTPNRVQQEDGNGCVVATLAMICGKSYRQVRDDIQAFCGHHENEVWVTGEDFKDRGLALDHQGLNYLCSKGFAIRRMYRCDPATNKPRVKWPVLFAEPHPMFLGYLASVALNNNQHAIYVGHDGSVLDPWREGCYKLSDYENVSILVAVYDVRANSDISPAATNCGDADAVAGNTEAGV